jgi:hypothetical protein
LGCQDHYYSKAISYVFNGLQNKKHIQCLLLIAATSVRLAVPNHVAGDPERIGNKKVILKINLINLKNQKNKSKK